MKQQLFIFIFLVASNFGLQAQTSAVENTLILDKNTSYQVTQAKIMGVKKNNQDLELYYSFTHPDGGVQKVTGSLFSGGKEPTNLTAFGRVYLPTEGELTTDPIHWLAPRNSKTNLNLYAKPLNNAAAHSQKPLAQKGQIAPFDTLATLKRRLDETGELSSIPFPEVAGENLPLVEQYYNTIVYVGLGGGVNQILTINYRLKSKEDRGKTLSMSDYDSENDINKDHVKGIFGASNISFKQAAGAIPIVCDPLSGNVVVMGGIKYKKDKTKKDSEYSEFRLFTFNKDGGLVNSVNYESDQPISIQGGYPIYGKQLDNERKEVIYVAIIARGGGSRKMTGVNKKLLKILIVDIKTGEIVTESERELSQEKAILLESRQLSNNQIELLFYYPVGGKRGLALMTIGKEGLIDLKEFNGDSPELKSLNLPAGYFVKPMVRSVKTLALKDGETLEFKEIYQMQAILSESGAKTTKKEEKTITFALFKYAADGKLKFFKALDTSFNANEANLLSVHEDSMVFFEEYKEKETNKNKIRFVNINIETLDSQLSDLSSEFFLTDSSGFHLDKENQQLLFLTQTVSGKGLYLSRYQF